MKVINARNVNDALEKGIDLFQDPTEYRVQESRNGITYEAKTPVATVYKKPWERVCLIKQRDANPFFHFIEGLWMLDGRNDLEPLTYFVKSMFDFSDDGETLWGAYGWRWRSYWNKDQIAAIIGLLKDNPYERRAVLQMWDTHEDLARACNKKKERKDVPCNTNIYFKVRDGKLCMTVCNRSNDMLWGAYGANAVHMSVLQEYMASALDVGMGAYYQVSDSFHVYENKGWSSIKHKAGLFPMYKYPDVYPLVAHPKSFPFECEDFIEQISGTLDEATLTFPKYQNPFFNEVLEPMVKTFVAHKERNYVNADKYLSEIKADDWKVTCTNWINKRRTAYEKKHGH